MTLPSLRSKVFATLPYIMYVGLCCGYCSQRNSCDIITCCRTALLLLDNYIIGIEVVMCFSLFRSIIVLKVVYHWHFRMFRLIDIDFLLLNLPEIAIHNDASEEKP